MVHEDPLLQEGNTRRGRRNLRVIGGFVTIFMMVGCLVLFAQKSWDDLAEYKYMLSASDISVVAATADAIADADTHVGSAVTDVAEVDLNNTNLVAANRRYPGEVCNPYRDNNMCDCNENNPDFLRAYAKGWCDKLCGGLFALCWRALDSHEYYNSGKEYNMGPGQWRNTWSNSGRFYKKRTCSTHTDSVAFRPTGGIDRNKICNNHCNEAALSNLFPEFKYYEQQYGVWQNRYDRGACDEMCGGKKELCARQGSHYKHRGGYYIHNGNWCLTHSDDNPNEAGQRDAFCRSYF